jgi:hypothetical protein
VQFSSICKDFSMFSAPKLLSITVINLTFKYSEENEGSSSCRILQTSSLQKWHLLSNLIWIHAQRWHTPPCPQFIKTASGEFSYHKFHLSIIVLHSFISPKSEFISNALFCMLIFSKS